MSSDVGEGLRVRGFAIELRDTSQPEAREGIWFFTIGSISFRLTALVVKERKSLASPSIRGEDEYTHQQYNAKLLLALSGPYFLHAEF
jgi:hypothetical protein